MRHQDGIGLDQAGLAAPVGPAGQRRRPAPAPPARGGQPAGRQRLEILARTHSGFDVADADLRMRGPGEVFGVRQSGALRFKVVELPGDTELMLAAREEANRLLKADPGLVEPQNRSLALMAERRFSPQAPLAGVA